MTKINHRFTQRAISFLILIAIAAASVIPASAQRRRSPRLRSRTRTTRTVTRTVEPATPRYTVPADTIIRVRLNEQLNSSTARIGDRFSANVTEPVYAGSGAEVIPVGSKVWGRVSSVTLAQRRKAGSISVAFNSVQLPNGTSYVINGSLSSLQADNVNADNEGTVAGKNNDKRNAVFIGGGAASGALIGAIAGGGKGAAIGAVIGGAVGTGGVMTQRGKDLRLERGQQLVIRTSR